MFSIEKCRKIESSLNELTDDEVVDIRDSLYELAQLALEDYFENNSGSKNP